MGNGSFCTSPKSYIKDIRINICLDNKSINIISEQDLNKEEKSNKKPKNGIIQLKKYFDENEKEIINTLNQREKAKKNINKKKRQSMYIVESNNKYELMLKRLLDQKKIQRNGPKRRETIRNEEKIKILIKEILIENKNEVKKNMYSCESNNSLNKSGTLLIKNKNNSKMRFSSTIDIVKPDNKTNNKVNKKFQNQHLKNANTLNEIINEVNASTDLGKKETNKK